MLCACAAPADTARTPDSGGPATLEPAAPSESVQTQSAEARLQPEAQQAQTTARPTDALDTNPIATTLAVEPEQMTAPSPEAIDPLAESEPQDAAADARAAIMMMAERLRQAEARCVKLAIGFAEKAKEADDLKLTLQNAILQRKEFAEAEQAKARK